MQPRVGILREPERLDARYARALEEAGATGVALPLGRGIDDLDALLVPGGGDFLPPAPYPATARFDPVPEAQLRADTARLESALARGLPVLGICYGMQLLVTCAGGRLLYDLATDAPRAGIHQLDEHAGRHPIDVVAGSALARQLGATRLDVNSSHHQAVAEAGTGLRVVAQADDGVVEAIEASDPARFVLGVQWHPERMPEAHRACLFPAFVAAAAARR